MLTPMSKYYASEMCVQVASEAIQVLGGSGYMKDYPVERHLRDARITTIYEGTSQLQVVAAVRGVCSPALEKFLDEFEQVAFGDAVLVALAGKMKAGRQLLGKAIGFVKEKGGNYMDLSGRRLVDSAITLIVGHLLLGQAAAKEGKRAVAKRFIEMGLPTLGRDVEVVCGGDMGVMERYEELAGPVPGV